MWILLEDRKRESNYEVTFPFFKLKKVFPTETGDGFHHRQINMKQCLLTSASSLLNSPLKRSKCDCTFYTHSEFTAGRARTTMNTLQDRQRRICLPHNLSFKKAFLKWSNSVVLKLVRCDPLAGGSRRCGESCTDLLRTMLLEYSEKAIAKYLLFVITTSMLFAIAFYWKFEAAGELRRASHTSWSLQQP